MACCGVAWMMMAVFNGNNDITYIKGLLTLTSAFLFYKGTNE